MGLNDFKSQVFQFPVVFCSHSGTLWVQMPSIGTDQQAPGIYHSKNMPCPAFKGCLSTDDPSGHGSGDPQQTDGFAEEKCGPLYMQRPLMGKCRIKPTLNLILF